MSINIEEERVAFDYATPLDEYVTITNREYYNLYREHLFGIWLKAKEHAVEMAKQEVEFQESIYGWSVYAMRNGQRSFTASMEHSSKDDAVQWAKGNGYRVIEE